MFGIFYCILLVILLVIFLIATLIVFPLTVPFDPSRRVVHEISRGIALLFFSLPPGWRTRVSGIENIDKSQTYVIVLNHSAMVDIPMLYWVRLNFRWISKASNRSLPFFGQFMWLHGDILIPTDKPRKAAAMVMTDGLKWLKERKVNISVFPEGTRSKTGQIGRFKPTAFALAKEAGVAVLPVVLDGSKFITNGFQMPWRHNFTLKVLPPVSAEEVAEKDPKDVMEQVRERMIEAKKSIENGRN